MRCQKTLFQQKSLAYSYAELLDSMWNGKNTYVDCDKLKVKLALIQYKNTFFIAFSLKVLFQPIWK